MSFPSDNLAALFKTAVAQSPPKTFDLQPKSSFDLQPKSSFDLQPKSSFDLQPKSSFDLQPKSSFDLQPKSSFDLQPTNAKIDVYVQTEAPPKFSVAKFKASRDLVTNKVAAISFMSSFKKIFIETNSIPSPNFELSAMERAFFKGEEPELADINLGVIALGSVEDKQNAHVIKLYTNVVRALIEETIATPDQLYEFLTERTSDKTLLYAIKLARHEPGAFQFSDENWIECFAVALSLFAARDNKPFEVFESAVNISVSLPKAKSLIVGFVCNFIAASYGTGWFPENWKRHPNYADSVWLAERMMR